MANLIASHTEMQPAVRSLRERQNCIHSLPDNWHKGYGSQMMDRVLEDIKEAGYSEVVLWVFRDNARARAFYEAKGFTLTDISKPAFDTEEVLYFIEF